MRRNPSLARPFFRPFGLLVHHTHLPNTPCTTPTHPRASTQSLGFTATPTGPGKQLHGAVIKIVSAQISHSLRHLLCHPETTPFLLDLSQSPTPSRNCCLWSGTRPPTTSSSLITSCGRQYGRSGLQGICSAVGRSLSSCAVL